MLNTEPINVLIVDDNEKNLFTLQTLIEQYINAHIWQAQSGKVALRMLLKKSVDLIILDVQMPEMDGFETAKIIQSRQKSQHIPIVFLTAAYKAEEFLQKGFEIGAVDYLTKPIDTPQLINRIKSYVRFIEQDRQYKEELEHTVQERTAELLKAHNELERRVEERTTELLEAKTQAEQAQIKAEQAQQMAEKASLAKSQFLANMSHELRTPLNAIIGYSEMLQEEAEDSEQEDYLPELQKIQVAGKHLLGLINEVLDLSKIDTGKMDLCLETVELCTVLNETVSSVQPLLEKNTNLLKTLFDDNLGNMHTDTTKLRQILWNLLSNAAKFTEEGIIHLEVKRDGEWINFCIIDNGIGIIKEQQKQLFQAFTQADSSSTRRYGGTGLGLTITKQFTEMLGGTIWVESEFGQGSTFVVSLPVQIETVLNPESPKTLNLLKGEGVILIIDDNASVCELLENDLSKLGYAVAVATDGEEGIQLAYKLHPDAILIDIGMSEMESWEVLSNLKNDSLLAHIPVILVTMEENQQQGYAMGATDCIDKTMMHSQLSTVLQKYQIGNHSTSLVMIVEDDEMFNEIITKSLESQGWQVCQAENGQVALELLDNNKPDLILLDLSMPIMDGFEFLTHLYNNKKWCSTPVIVLTAKNLNAEEQAHLNKHVEIIFPKNAYAQNKLIWHIHQLIAEVLPSN